MDEILVDEHEEEEYEDAPVRKHPGRPKGAKNKPKETLLTEERLHRMAARMRPYLSKEQRRYLDATLKGEVEVDPIREAEMLTVQMRLMQTEALTHLLSTDTPFVITRDYSSFLAEYRQNNKDLFEMKRKAASDAKQEDDSVIDLVAGNPLERLGIGS